MLEIFDKQNGTVEGLNSMPDVRMNTANNCGSHEVFHDLLHEWPEEYTRRRLSDQCPQRK